MKNFVVYFVIILAFSLCKKEEEKDYKESNEEFLSKQIEEKLNKYLKEKNLENAKTIDKKTFAEIFTYVSTDSNLDEFIAPEAKKLGNIGEDYAKDLPENIPVADLKKLLSFDEIMGFFLKTVKIDDYPKNDDPLNMNKNKVVPGSSRDTSDL